jgi:small multidrug resistance pump
VIEAVLLAGSVATQGLSLAAMRASEGLRRVVWAVAAFAAMGASVLLMARALEAGLSLTVGYGVWSGAGIALGVAIGLASGDRLARGHVLGLALVLVGVLLVYGG